MSLFPELQECSPSLGAYRAEPMSVAEIDAHPEVDRIWATIMDIRPSEELFTMEEVEEQCREAEDAANKKASDDIREKIDNLCRKAEHKEDDEGPQAALDWLIGALGDVD